MRVAIVSDTYPPEINGVAHTVQGYAHGLRALGHEVTVVRPCQAGELPQLDAQQVLVRGAPVPRYAGLRFGYPCQQALHAHWQARRPDVLYIATEGPLGWSAQRAARRLGIPFATGLHTRFDQYASAYRLGWLEPLVSRWLRRFHARAGATLVPTAELAAELQARGYATLEVLGRGVDTALFQPARRDRELRRRFGADDDTVLLLHVGRLAPEKNLELAMRGWEGLARWHHNLRFVVVGDGPERAKLEAHHPGVVFTGALPRELVARCYASADVFMFPSLSETFGNVVLEALASGVPLVGFDYAAAHRHVQHGVSGLLAPCGDEQAFLRELRRLATDAELRERIRPHARAAVAASSTDAAVQRFHLLLDTLVRQGARA